MQTPTEPPRPVRFKRRAVPHIRVTWVAMVALLLYLTYRWILDLHPMGMVGRAGLFIPMVVVPVLLLSLWRAGLLPPERVEDGPPAPPSP